MLPLIQQFLAHSISQASPVQKIISKFRNQERNECTESLDLSFELSKNTIQIQSAKPQTAQQDAFKSLDVFEPKCTQDQKEQLKSLKTDDLEFKFNFNNITGLIKLGEFCQMNQYNYLSTKSSIIALDFFFKSDKLYGFPMHSTNLLIPESCNCPQPYCLNNYDKACYVGKQTLGLYGSMPMLIIPCLGKFIGMVWKNASRTWMDVRRSQEGMELVIISEEGDLDFEIFVYDKIENIFLKFGQLCGFSQMPRYFGLGYQHCRWSFDDEKDVRQVNDGFNDNKIPYDIIYLDIDHTDKMKYFTFDKTKYPDIDGMIQKLAIDGRKLVTIVDPHIKVDPDYYIYEKAKKNGYFVKDKNLKDVVGKCWPGSSSWIDYMNEDAREFWAQQFLTDNYRHTNENVYIWNDMNEPAIFNQKNAFPQGTQQKLITKDKVAKFIPHDLVHNLYGHSMTLSTYKGLMMRDQGMKRPFVLSRSFFCGSQQYAAFWTGDTQAKWEDFQVQIPILLTMGLCGHNFTGCDIGGFFGNPTEELLVRWYQFGALIPFFRGHSHHRADRREPWLYSKETLNLIKEAIQLRYELLPYLYTQMFVSHITNFPFLSPLWAMFPNEETNFYVENQFMVGKSLLFYPIVKPSTELEYIYINNGEANAEFYDYFQLNRIETQQIPQLQKIHLYIQAGKIIPLFKIAELQFKSSEDLRKNGNYKIIIALNNNNESEGEFYLDDGDSFNFEQQVYIFKTIKYSNGKISIKDKFESMKNQNKPLLPCFLTEIIICGIKMKNEKFIKNMKFTQLIGKDILIINGLNLNLRDNVELNIFDN